MAEEKTKESKEASEKSGLNPAQITAAGLAAVTAAFLGSSLGVYGTVLGAGLMSVLTTVGSEIYLRSLKTSKKATAKAKAMAVAITDARGWQAKPAGPQQPTQRITEQPTVPTAPMPVPDEQRTDYLPKPGEEQAERRQWWKRRWPLLLVTSAVAFVIGLLVLTGFEGITGKSLTGGDGVTVGKLLGSSGGTGGTEQDDQQQDPAPATTESEETTQPGEPEDTTTEPTTSPTTEQQEPTESSESSTEETPTEEETPTPQQDSGGEAGAGADATATPDAAP